MQKAGRKSAGRRPITLVAWVIAMFVVALLVLVVLSAQPGAPIGAARAYNIQPQPNPIEPNPELEGNVTFSTHNSNWPTLGYVPSAGPAPANLSAVVDPRVVNPIQVVGADVLSAGILQGEKPSGSTTFWNQTSFWSTAGVSCGQTETVAATTINGQPAIQITANTSNANGAGCATTAPATYVSFSVSNWPSTSPQFDYVTMAVTYTGPSCPTGGSCLLSMQDWNQSAGITVAYRPSTGAVGPNSMAGSTALSLAPGQTGWYSASLAQLTGPNAGFNTTGVGAATQLKPELTFGFPKAASTTYTATITAFAFGTSPLTLGNTIWRYTLAGGTTPTNNTIQRGACINACNLTALNPTFTYSSVAGGGYSAAIVQQATNLADPANVSVTTSPVNVANASGGPGYVEQGTYQFTFGFPTAAGLTFGTFKLADHIQIAGGQYISVSFGGTSYTAAYQGYTIGKWQTVQSTAAPQTATTWLGVVDFTGPQWDSISVAPGIFSPTGFQYYWFIFLGLILAVVGGSSAWITKSERQLKGRHGHVDLTFSAARRRFRRLRGKRAIGRMEGRHLAAIIIGLLLVGAGLISVWALLSGADVAGIAAAFVGGFLILALVLVVAFIAYEIAHNVRKRRHHPRG